MSEARRFLVKGLLGQGGFGRVYLAEMVSAGGFRKEVALKVLSDGGHTHPQAAVRLRDEARLLGLLRHRNIVAVDDLVRLDEGWGVVMEVVHGVDLGVLVSYIVHLQDLFPARAAVEVTRGIARALEAAYTHAPSGAPLKAIHRDIKPGNVRITPEGEVKVLDFGIARADFQAREAITGEGRFGSLAYMSPERVMGDADTSAGDIYALGIVLWESLVGRPRGRAVLREPGHDSQIAQMMDTLQHRPDLDEVAMASLTELLCEMLAFKPADRPDAAQVGARLRLITGQLSGEDLESVSRRVIPQIRANHPAVTPAGIDELHTQTLSEVDDTRTISFVHDAEEPTVSDVSTRSGAATEALDSTAAPPATRPAWLPWAGGALVSMLVVAAGGLFAASQWLPQPSETAPVDPSAPTATDPAEPPPSPAAPAAPEAPVPVEAAPVPVEAGQVDDPEQSTAPIESATPTPDPEPAPEPAPEPEPVPTPVPEPEPAPPQADSPRIRAAKFAASNVESVQASCNGITGSGSSSALVRDFPAGQCTVSVMVGGQKLTTRLQVDAPRGYTCAVTDGVLACH